MIVGRYGDKNFTWGAEGINTFSNFSLSYKAKSQDLADKDGTPVANVKGVEIGGFNISILSHKHGDIDPDKELEEWKGYIEDGEGREFYVGERKIGEYKWRVASLSVSNIRLDKQNLIDSCAFEIGFEEVAPEPSQDKKKKKSASQKKSAPAIGTPQSDQPILNIEAYAHEKINGKAAAAHAPKSPASQSALDEYKTKNKWW